MCNLSNTYDFKKNVYQKKKQIVRLSRWKELFWKDIL